MKIKFILIVKMMEKRVNFMHLSRILFPKVLDLNKREELISHKKRSLCN